MATEADEALARMREKVRLYKMPYGPGTAVVHPAAPDLGGFLRQNVIAAAILKGFPDCFAAAVFKGAPDWRAFVVDCNPYIRLSLETDPGHPVTIPVDWFDFGWAAPVRCPDPTWYEKGLQNAELILLPGMLALDPARFPGLAEAPPLFHLPEHQEPALRAALAGTGIPENGWFVCLEGGAEATEPLRAAVEARGGVAIQIGETRRMAGGINLSGAPVALQAAALRFARLALGTGPVTGFASAFGTPTGGLGPDSLGTAVWNRGDVVAASSGRIDEMMGLLLDRTEGAGAWRPPTEEIPVPARTCIPFPLRAEAEPQVLVLA